MADEWTPEGVSPRDNQSAYGLIVDFMVLLISLRLALCRHPDIGIEGNEEHRVKSLGKPVVQAGKDLAGRVII